MVGILQDRGQESKGEKAGPRRKESRKRGEKTVATLEKIL